MSFRMRKEPEVRRRTGGLLLPGLVLTALAVAGVVILLAVGSPIVPRRLPGFPVNAQDERRSVPVAPSRSNRPSPPVTPTPTPTGPTVAPTTDAPDEPRTSPTSRRTSGPTSGPTSARPTTRPTAAPTTDPPPPRCKAGSATVAAAADTYVDQASPGQSFGAMGNLLVASRDKERNRRALVRFALPAVPAGCTLRSATLTLTAKDVTGQRLLVSRASRAWTESVTWSTAPAPSGTAVAATVSARTVSWTVTSLVAAQLGGGNHGFVVKAATENARGAGEQTNFTARSAPSGPSLVLRWS